MRKTALNKKSYSYIKNLLWSVAFFGDTKELVKKKSKAIVLCVASDMKSISSAHLIADILEIMKIEVEIKYYYIGTSLQETPSENLKLLSDFFDITIDTSVKLDIFRELERLKIFNKNIKRQNFTEKFRHLRQNLFIGQIIYPSFAQNPDACIFFVNGHKLTARGDRLDTSTGEIIINKKKNAMLNALINDVDFYLNSQYIGKLIKQKIEKMRNRMFLLRPMSVLLGSRYENDYFSTEAIAAIENTPGLKPKVMPSPDIIKDKGLTAAIAQIKEDYPNNKEAYKKVFAWEKKNDESFIRGQGLLPCSKFTLTRLAEEAGIDTKI